MNQMFCRLALLSIAAPIAVAVVARPVGIAQDLAADLKAKLAAAKQAAAKNQASLRTYQWLEQTQLSLKGEVKNTKVSMCRYDTTGKVQKTPVVAPPPEEKKRGLRGKMVEKKKEEMKDELEAASALVHQYLPPAPDMMQVVMNAGTASLSQAGAGAVALKFPGYLKSGDSLTLTFDSTVKALRQVAVATWLDDPSKPVTLNVVMQSLPDGTNYPGTVTLAIPSSQLQVQITNSNYQKVAP